MKLLRKSPNIDFQVPDYRLRKCLHGKTFLQSRASPQEMSEEILTRKMYIWLGRKTLDIVDRKGFASDPRCVVTGMIFTPRRAGGMPHPIQELDQERIGSFSERENSIRRNPIWMVPQGFPCRHTKIDSEIAVVLQTIDSAYVHIRAVRSS